MNPRWRKRIPKSPVPSPNTEAGDNQMFNQLMLSTMLGITVTPDPTLASLFQSTTFGSEPPWNAPDGQNLAGFIVLNENDATN